MDIITLDRVSKAYGSNLLLDDFSLFLKEGEILGLVGSSGCGKTTILKLLTGLEVPTGGRILMGSKDLRHVPPKERDTRILFPSLPLFEGTVREHIATPLIVQRGWTRAEIGKAVLEVAERVKASHLLDRKTNGQEKLSAGERQRVALAGTLVGHPSVVLLDEPLSALDAVLRREMLRELRDLLEDCGTSAIYVTHSPEEAFAICDRVAVMHRVSPTVPAELLQVGTPGEIYDRPATVLVGQFFGLAGMNLLPRKDVCSCTHTGEIPQGAVQIGVRPEDVLLDIAACPAHHDGEVLRAVRTEHEWHLTIRTGNHLIVARSERPVPKAKEISICFSNAHPYDAQGRRL